jgi:uncharacterized protein involved in outer membrane biogenesis
VEGDLLPSFIFRGTTMPKKKKIAIIAAALLFILLLFTITVLPYIIRDKAIAEIGKATGRKIRIEAVTINPFTLTVGLKGFVIEESNGGPFVSIGKLRASLSLASIYKRALVMDEVAVDAPSFSITRIAPNRYNFSDIIERQKPSPEPEKKGEFLFSINNITIRNGSLDFNDQAVGGGRRHTIRNFELTVPFISNTPYLVEKYTDPHLSALINGSLFSFDGKVKPLSKSMETSVRIALKEFSLPEYVAYAPVRTPVDLASGRLSLDTEVTYRVSSDKKPELGIKGVVRLDGVAVNLKNGKPLLRLPLFQARAADLELFARRFLLDSVVLDGLELFVSRDAHGEWMFSRLLPSQANGKKRIKPVAEKKAEPVAKVAQPLVRVASFALNNGSVHFNDAQPTGGFKGEITQIDAALKNFTTAPDKSADYELSMLLDSEATLAVDGTFSLVPLAATASTELSGLKLQRGWPYLSRFLTAPVKGTIDVASEISYSKQNGLVVEQGAVRAEGLSVRYGNKEGFDLARFEVSGAGYRQKENAAEIAEIKLSRGSISLSREADGSISPLSLLKKAKGTSKQPVARHVDLKSPATSGQSPARDLSFRLKRFQLERFNAAFTDKTLQEMPRFTLTNTSMSLANLSGPTFKSSPFRFATTFNKATPLKVNGAITPSPFRFKGNASVGRLPLRDFEAYFPSNINVFILDGSVDTSMKMDIAVKDGKPTGSFMGDAGIRGFHAIDTEEEEDLLKWESLQLDGIQGSLEPFSLALHQIALNGVYSRIIIHKDGTLNLQNLVEKPGQETAGKETSTTVTKTAAPTSAPSAGTGTDKAVASKKQIRIDAITIQDGTLSFSDNHLPQHFDTTFYNLGGRVSGLSSEDSKLAEVDLRGNLENHSPLQITGQINPLRDDLFVDLKVSFRDIELSPVTPYSGTYLGYTVEKGKLYLDLTYHIDKKQLNSENRIFIDQFTFGDKVESDKATSLPVKLGLALLKDRKGEIHLDVPVTGRTDDPKFSIWRLVFQVVRNLLVKAVTSPFSLLSSMFGGGQDFSAVQFNQGASTVASPEERKLSELAKVLLDRPALKIELKGYVDREKDVEGYRAELLGRKVRNEKFLALAREQALKPGETSETIQVSPLEYPKYLAAVYKKEKFPKPRNILGLVKNLPPEEMRKLIITNTMVGESELQALARERVVAVMNYLVKQGNVPAERVFQKIDDVFKSPEKEGAPRSRVELNAIAQ